MEVWMIGVVIAALVVGFGMVAVRREWAEDARHAVEQLDATY